MRRRGRCAAFCAEKVDDMTLTEALPMLRNGMSLDELRKIAEKKKAEAKPDNVVNLSQFRAKRTSNDSTQGR